jgi:hypothetical protein
MASSLLKKAAQAVILVIAISKPDSRNYRNTRRIEPTTGTRDAVAPIVLDFRDAADALIDQCKRRNDDGELEMI